jgi:DnaJ-class molecular chaperone
MFHEIKKAYDVLIDPLSRNKYNAGLKFEALAKMTPRRRVTRASRRYFDAGN